MILSNSDYGIRRTNRRFYRQNNGSKSSGCRDTKNGNFFFAMEGNYRGIPCTDVGTYMSVLREGGVLYGEGQGIITTKDGKGMATWTGQGIGKFTAPGKVSFRGSIFLRTPSTSQGGKLSSLNNMVGVFEYEVDEMGSCFTKSWEWK